MRKTRKRYRKIYRKSRKSRKGGASLDNSRENGPQDKRQKVDYVDLAKRLLSEAGIPKGELTKNEQNDLDRWKESRKGLAASAAENREKRGPHTFPRGVHIPTLIHSIYDQLIRERGIDAKNMTREEYLKYKEDFISGITTDPRFVRIAEENRTESLDPRFSFSRKGFTQHVSGLGVIGRLEPRRPPIAPSKASEYVPPAKPVQHIIDTNDIIQKGHQRWVAMIPTHFPRADIFILVKEGETEKTIQLESGMEVFKPNGTFVFRI